MADYNLTLLRKKYNELLAEIEHLERFRLEAIQHKLNRVAGELKRERAIARGSMNRFRQRILRWQRRISTLEAAQAAGAILASPADIRAVERFLHQRSARLRKRKQRAKEKYIENTQTKPRTWSEQEAEVARRRDDASEATAPQAPSAVDRDAAGAQTAGPGNGAAHAYAAADADRTRS